MKFSATFILFFCATVSVFAQQSVLLKGKIKADSLMEASVHIVNLTQKKGTVNSEDGSFQIEVKKNDTLFFSSVQFESDQIIVDQQIIDNPFLEIKLVPIELEEVKISNISLSGNLERDISGIEVTEPLDFGLPKRIGPKLTSSERKIYTASSSSLETLLNVISGRLKMLKRHDANMKRVALVNEAQSEFPNAFFLEELDLNSEEIDDFLFFCAETDSEFKERIASNDPFELIEYFQSMLPGYLEEKRGEGRDAGEADPTK